MVGCRSFEAHAHHQSSGHRRRVSASWADALHMVGMRNPTVADAVESMSSHEEPVEECFGEIKKATDRLNSEGFWWRPSWPDLRAGNRPETHAEGEPGKWQYGWQYWSSSISDSYFRKGTMLSGCTAARRAYLCHILVGTQEWRWYNAPQVLSSPSRRTCSGHCFWNGCHCHCR